jgi:hypothetical protein
MKILKNKKVEFQNPHQSSSTALNKICHKVVMEINGFIPCHSNLYHLVWWFFFSTVPSSF